MGDFISANCADCSELEFYSYDFACEVQDAAIQALGFALCGYSVGCPTTEADYTTLINNDHFRVIKGVAGTRADPTPVDIDTSSYSCLPDRFVKEYQEVLNFTVPYRIENYNFWNQIYQNSTIVEQAFYTTQSGITYEIPESPSVFVSQVQENNIEIISGTIEWTARTLPQPFQALGSIWGC